MLAFLASIAFFLAALVIAVIGLMLPSRKARIIIGVAITVTVSAVLMALAMGFFFYASSSSSRTPEWFRPMKTEPVDLDGPRIRHAGI